MATQYQKTPHVFIKNMGEVIKQEKSLDFVLGLKLPPAVPLKIEQAVYNVMKKGVSDYDGGVWQFIKIDNETFFLYPVEEKNYNFAWVDNHSNENLDNISVGIVVTLMAVNHLSFAYPNGSFIDFYHRLRCAYYDVLERIVYPEDYFGDNPKIDATPEEMKLINEISMKIFRVLD